MLTPPHQVYPDKDEHALVNFDVRTPGVGRRFSRERAAWGAYGDVELLDLDHPVLIARPGASAIRDGEHGE